jgi:hypothetical protein
MKLVGHIVFMEIIRKLYQIFGRKSHRKGDPGIDGIGGRTILKYMLKE